MFASTVRAAVTATVTALPVDNQAILPKSGNIEVFGLDMNDAGGDTRLVSITIRFAGIPATNWIFNINDIERVAVYADTELYRQTGNGVFSNGDVLIGEVLNPASTTVTVPCGLAEIPWGDTEDFLLDDFFVVINTSDTIRDDDPSTTGNEGHAFTITIWNNDIVFSDAGSTAFEYAPTADLSTQTIYCEAWASDLTPFSSLYGFPPFWYYYPGNGDSIPYDGNRYPYSVPDEWIRPRYDVGPTDREQYGPGHWPLSQLLNMETRTPVLGIDCGGGTTNNRVTLNSVKVTFTALSPDFDPTTGLDSLIGSTAAGMFSGVALYRDTGDGVWTYGTDAIVPVSFGAGWVDAGGGVWELTLTPTTPGNEYIKTTWDDNDLFDYFIVIRADSGFLDDAGWAGDGVGIKFGATFTVSIQPGDVHFSDRPTQDPTDPANDTGLLTNPSQPYVTNVKEIHPVLEIHDMVADPALSHVQRIDATSPPTPIFGINITDTTIPRFTDGEKLKWVIVYLHDVNGTDITPISDFRPLSANETSGLSLWMDDKTAGDSQIGVFDSGDIFVPVGAFSWTEVPPGGVWLATLSIPDWQDVLGDDVYNATNRGDDYFVCIRTSATLSYNDQFFFEIPDAGVGLAHHDSAVGSGIAVGNTLTANFPVFLTDLTTAERIFPGSLPTPVIGIDTWDDTGSGGKLQQVIVEFYNPDGINDMDFNPEYDLLSKALDAGSGIAIYQDSPVGTPGGRDGVFDSTDTVIPLSNIEWVGVTHQPDFQCLLEIAAPPLLPTDNTTLGNVGPDYFIVIRTTADESSYQPGDDFSVGIVSWGYEEDYQTPPQPAPWGQRALGFIDGTGQLSRSYERIQTDVVGNIEPPAPDYCGNGACEPLRGEDATTCPADCGSVVNCGNGVCDPEEDATTCPMDCGGSSGGGGVGSLSGCFIATACYGTPMAEEVRVLSQFRDEYLLTNSLGRFFVGTYYKFSPQIAEYISQRPILKKFIRIELKPLVSLSEKLIEE